MLIFKDYITDTSKDVYKYILSKKYCYFLKSKIQNDTKMHFLRFYHLHFEPVT